MNYTDQVLEFIIESDWDALAPEIQHQAKRCLMDTLGATIAGIDTPVGRLISAFSSEYLNGIDCTILVSGDRASPLGAALANGFAGNALDIDDGHRLVKGHPGSCVLPVILAASEIDPPKTGAAFLNALVVGYEVGIRSGLICHALYETFHGSGSWGAVGGAAAAGKLLGLDAPALRNAMGAAEYHAPISPMMKGIQVPSMVKDGIGWGATVALSSVLLARLDFTGIEPLFSDTPNKAWIDELGKVYQILNLYFKPHAVCRWAQPAVAGALKVVREYKISPSEIARVRVLSFEEAARLSCAHPRTTEEAQYNLAYPVAAALIDGEVGPRQILPPRIHEPSLLDVADKVKVEVERQFDNAFPEKTIAEVIIHTTDGRKLSSEPVEALWEATDIRPTDADLEDKFMRLVGPVLGHKEAKMVAAMIWELEKVPAIEELIKACVRG